MSELHENIKKLLKYAGKTPGDVAKALNVPPARIHELINGTVRNPTIERLSAVVQCVGGSLDAVVFGDGVKVSDGLPPPIAAEENTPYALERRRDLAWKVADDQARENAVFILENSARRSPGKGAGESSSARKKSALR